MVDIVDSRLRVDQLDKVLDDLDDVELGEYPCLGICGKTKLLVETETSDRAQVISLFREEELVDHVLGCGLIRRFRVAELFVDVFDSLVLSVGRILLEGVEYDGIFVGICLVLLEKDGLDVCVEDSFDVLFVEDDSSLDDRHGPFDRNDLSCVVIFEILSPGLENLGCEFPALVCLQGLLIDRNLVSEVEYVDDVLVRVVADSPEKCRYRQLLLTVDVGIHHVVDVCCEFYPGALERDDSR